MKQNKVQMVTASFVVALVAILFGAGAVCAQTTSFTYQGRLTDGGGPANGNYDLQFALFDSLSGGTQIGSTQTLSNMAISGGSLTATLDFGASAFPGANRYLEISMRSSGGPSFTTLSPRQQITSTPYAIRALNATNAIQNSTTQQPNSNFNISGNGIAGGTLRAQRYNLPNVGSVVPFFGLSDSTHFGLCGADNSGVILGCNLQVDLTNAPNSTSLVVSGPASFETLTADNVTISGPAVFSLGLTVNGPTQQLISNVPIAVNRLGFSGSTPLCLNSGNQISSCGSVQFSTGLTVNGQPLVANDLITANSFITANILGTGGSSTLCRDGAAHISFCSSSLRYKKDISAFIGGLDIIHRLRPISFTWKDHPERDLGLAAEEVATVEPRLVTRNSKGEIEGVKYDRLTAVLVNAIKQQQTQIEQQQGQIQSLKKLVCRNHRKASACK